MFRRDFFGFLGLSPLAFLKEKPDKDGSTFIGLLKNCPAPVSSSSNYEDNSYRFRRKHWDASMFLKVYVASYYWKTPSCFVIMNNKNKEFYVTGVYLNIDNGKVCMTYFLTAEELSSKDWIICEKGVSNVS
jgi:hypothetical protein